MNGDTQKIEALLAGGADVHAKNDEALRQAAACGQIAAMRLLLGRGTDIHAGALSRAAEYGHTDVVRLLLGWGADVNAGNDYALRYAAGRGHTDVVRLLLDCGADIHADNDHALRWAAERGHINVVRLLLDRGADIHADNDRALRWAAERGHIEMVHLLIERGAPLKLLNKEMLKSYHEFRVSLEKWKKTARCKPPRGLLQENPAYFRPQPFAALKKMLAQEGFTDEQAANKLAFAAIALFGGEQRVLQYLEKWGGASKQPLHNAFYCIKAPKEPGADLKAWGDAVLKLGPDMAKLFAFADRLPVPEKSADGKTWSYQNTRAKVAQFVYARAGEHPELAALCYEHSQTEETFDEALELTKKQKRDIVKNLPQIVVDGKDFGMEGASFHPLPANDIRGLFLGELTDCCQSIGGNGAECAEHGFLSKNGGFYVVETEDHEIIGQTWAWRGKKGELVFDSLETLGGRVRPEQWEKLAVAFAEALKKDPGNVTALHIGAGGETPESLTKAFNAATARPADYKGYRDSHKQVAVWPGSPSRWAWLMKR